MTSASCNVCEAVICFIIFNSQKSVFSNKRVRNLRHLVNEFFANLLCNVYVISKPIYLLQKKAIRAIAFKSFTSPSTPIFSDLKILKLYDLFDFKLLTFVYESVNKISPSFFHNFFETLTTVHHYNTRQALKGDIFMTRENTLQYGLRCVRCAGAKSWNSIPDVIRQSPSVSNFRRKLKFHIFSTKYQN